MKYKRLSHRFCFSVMSILIFLLAIELILKTYASVAGMFRKPPLHVIVDSPLIYGLNPGYRGNNAQGLCGKEVQVPKLNGIANPNLHRDTTGQKLESVPDAAIPESTGS